MPQLIFVAHRYLDETYLMQDHDYQNEGSDSLFPDVWQMIEFTEYLVGVSCDP